MTDRLYNEKEAAKYLGISEQRLKDLASKKKLPAYNIGGKFLRFDPKALERFRESLSAAQGNLHKKYGLLHRIMDYVYYNDFYIIAAILILILLALVFRASF